MLHLFSANFTLLPDDPDVAVGQRSQLFANDAATALELFRSEIKAQLESDEDLFDCYQNSLTKEPQPRPFIITALTDHGPAIEGPVGVGQTIPVES